MGLGGSWEGLGTILEGSCEVLGASWCDMSVLDGPRADFGIERALPVRLTHTETYKFEVRNQEGWPRSGPHTLGRDPPQGAPGRHPRSPGEAAQAPRHPCARSIYIKTEKHNYRLIEWSID